MVISYRGIDQTMYYLFNKIDHLLLAKMKMYLQVINVDAKRDCRKKKNLTSKPTFYFKTPIAEIKDYCLNLLTLFCRKVYSLNSYA